MGSATGVAGMASDDNQRIADVVLQEQSRLGRFIRRRVPDPRDAEDILQDVFYELVEANRLLMPIDHVTAWLFRVARNRITDLFRRKKPEAMDEARLDVLMPSAEAGPDAALAHARLIDALADAIADLPKAQRDVFVAHELEGRSFKELAAETGVSMNTLLARKRYAVARLRARLDRVHDEFTKE
jgi:RNA polymerase sigma factor (sigma-70 family)